MKKNTWKYHTLSAAKASLWSDEFLKELNDLGKDGWELVASMEFTATTYQLVFKKPA